MCSWITPKLVGDQLPGCLSLMFQGPTKEAFSGSTISTLGNQNIDHLSILIDGPPKIDALTPNGDEESSSPEESHPQALTEPDVNLSIHPAPIA